MADSVEEDLYWEEFEQLSDAEADAILEVELRKFSDMIQSMDKDQLYSYRRRTRLDLCVRQRKLARQFEFFTPRLKETQLRLLAARIEWKTGHAPGNA